MAPFLARFNARLYHYSDSKRKTKQQPNLPDGYTFSIFTILKKEKGYLKKIIIDKETFLICSFNVLKSHDNRVSLLDFYR